MSMRVETYVDNPLIACTHVKDVTLVLLLWRAVDAPLDLSNAEGGNTVCAVVFDVSGPHGRDGRIAAR